MKIILILVASFILGGCAVGSFPQFPESVKEHYVTDVHDDAQLAAALDPDVQTVTFEPMLISAIINIEEIPPAVETVRCLKFNIISANPYKIKFVDEVPVKDCNGVGGYKAKDSVSIYNWMQDVYLWAEQRKKCFK